MIVPMKKVSLIVLKNERKDALEKLRKAGVMHLETVTGNSKELSALKADFSCLERAYLALDEIKAPKKKAGAEAEAGSIQVKEKADEIGALLDEKKKAEVPAHTVECAGSDRLKKTIVLFRTISL